MGYIDFWKDTVLVLDEFQAASYVNELMRYREVERLDDDTFDGLIEYGCTSTDICPLNDGVFGMWFIEPTSEVVAYKPEDIKARCDLYYVTIDHCDAAERCALSMFDKDWKRIRTYTLRWV